MYWSCVGSLSQQQTQVFGAAKPWMHPRPLFYLQAYSIGITLPKENGLKTASHSTVFVIVHSSPDSLPALNIILQQANSIGKKEIKFYSLVHSFSLRNPETEADTHKSRAKFLSFVSFFSPLGGKDWISNQMALPLEADSCFAHLCTPVPSLFTVAKFGIVCFQIREFLLRVC